MTTILHISDLHFGPPFVPRVAEALIDITPHLAPDAIVVSGDLTQRAKAEQFADAAAFLERLPDAPRVVIPGNHDVPLYRIAERLRDPHGLYKKYISPELDSVLRLDNLIIVGLDSTSPRRTISGGRLHLDQLDYCEKVFNEAPEDTFRIVVAHHQFAPAHDNLRDTLMQKTRRAIRSFTDWKVDMILGGHLHRAYVGNSLDFYPAEQRDRGIIIVQCGTTTSRRGRGREKEKNSFNLVNILEGKVQITHFMYFEEESQFAPLSHHVFPYPGRRLFETNLIDSMSSRAL